MSMRKLNSHTILSAKLPVVVFEPCNVFINFCIQCILALGSGQCLLYRLGSGLVLVFVLRCNTIAHTVLHVSHFNILMESTLTTKSGKTDNRYPDILRGRCALEISWQFANSLQIR